MCRQSMQTKAMAPSRQTPPRHARASRCRKAVKASARHLAGTHGELAMADAAEAADMAIDRDVVGRVGEHEIGALALQQPIEARQIAGIAAEQPVAPELPDVARPGHGRSGSVTCERDLVLGLTLAGRAKPRAASSSTRSTSASEKPVSSTSKSRSIERLQLDGEDLAVPAGVQRQLVVGDHVGPALRGVEVGQAQRRHLLQPQQLGGLDPAVAGDDLVLVADQHRVGEAEASMLSAICRICFLEWVRAFPG